MSNITGVTILFSRRVHGRTKTQTRVARVVRDTEAGLHDRVINDELVRTGRGCVQMSYVLLVYHVRLDLFIFLFSKRKLVFRGILYFWKRFKVFQTRD